MKPENKVETSTPKDLEKASPQRDRASGKWSWPSKASGILLLVQVAVILWVLRSGNINLVALAVTLSLQAFLPQVGWVLAVFGWFRKPTSRYARVIAMIWTLYGAGIIAWLFLR